MSERRPLDVIDLERRLGRLLGGDWHGWEADVAVPGAALLARVVMAESGRMVVSGVLLLGDAITAEQLRKIPIEAVENSTNLGVPLEKAGGGAELAHDRVREDLAGLPPLDRGDLSGEDFSALVAEHFKVWARYVPHPAAAMAAEWHVKSPTMHTWIREARLRGLLPEAKRGKAV